MWKWIVGALLVVVVFIAWGGWWAYHKLTSGGDAAIVTIAGSPERVFASLADPDSMALWMGDRATVTSTHHGILTVGDTLRVSASSRTGAQQQNTTWIVAEIVPGRLRALELHSDSTGRLAATRRDSLVAVGDSTMVISTIASPLFDSLRTRRGDSGSKIGSAAIDMSSKMMVTAFRLISEGELQRLKARIEGHSPTK